MSKELATKSDFYVQLEEFDKIQETCRKLLQTKHYQNLGESGVHAIMARAKALGIHPFEALNGGFICINGKVGLSTEMMAALVRQRGHSIQKDEKSTKENVILHGRRADNGDTWTCTFSRADAEAAGLWGTATWKKYPAVMLYNRCMSMLFRQLFPDLSLGAGYVEDELREIADSKNPGKVDIQQSDAIEIITAAQAAELELALEMCDKSYIESFTQRLAALNISSLTDLPLSLFDKAMSGAKKNQAKPMITNTEKDGQMTMFPTEISLSEA